MVPLVTDHMLTQWDGNDSLLHNHEQILTTFFLENPRTGVVLVPDIHFSKSAIDISVILQAVKMSDKIKAEQCSLNNVF